MLDFLAEIFVDFVLRFVLIYPGAFVWWLFSGCKGTVNDLVRKKDWYALGTVGVLAVAAIIIAMKELG